MLITSFAAIVLYIAGVTIAMYYLENWSIVDAVYFSMVLFTTVGYGDLLPTGPTSKILVCCLGLLGISSQVSGDCGVYFCLLRVHLWLWRQRLRVVHCHMIVSSRLLVRRLHSFRRRHRM